MKNDFEKKLKQDGQIIQTQAEKRLQKFDFNGQFFSVEKFEIKQTTNFKNWYIGLAAAISLSVLAWSFLQIDKPTIQPNNYTKINVSSISRLKQLPFSTEDRINKALLKEQQAIICDIKMLKQQFLSI